MKASFIIPVYGNWNLTQRCLDSLAATVNGIDHEILVVDDGSDQSTKDNLSQYRRAKLRTIVNQSNRGFAYSNNRAASEAKGAYLFLLNNDLELQPGWLEPMLAALESKPKLGLIGNVQLNAATQEIDHAGMLLDWQAKLSHKREVNRSLGAIPSYSKHSFITAACCGIRRSVYLSAGGFDEAFLNGCEDIDLCMRLKQCGYSIMVANHSVVHHHIGATRGAESLNEERNFRYLQARWKAQFANMAACRWPDLYMEQVWSKPRSCRWRLLKQALPRWLGVVKGPAPSALLAAHASLQRNERHWHSILDNWSDKRIRDHESRENANWMLDKFEYSGLHAHPERSEGLWIREKAEVKIPKGLVIAELSIWGTLLSPAPKQEEEEGQLGLKISVNRVLTELFFPLKEGAFEAKLYNPPILRGRDTLIEIELIGTARSNLYAYLGRITQNLYIKPKKWQKYRKQNLNKRLLVGGLRVNKEDILDFKNNPTSPLIFDYVMNYGNYGINLIGWFNAQLGIGESARIAAKALQTTSIEHNLVPLKVNCLAATERASLDGRITDTNPYPINLFHIDAPQSADIDHYHGNEFRKNRYNIAYWAWELPEFPDSWIKYFAYFDEIWAPSNFTRDSISMKAPHPVITMPHCIEFSRPEGNSRDQFGLPSDKFLFNFVYDLNSYQERKNPQAVIKAFKLAFSGSDMADDVGLVLKTQSVERNKDAYQKLISLLQGIPNIYLIDKTLSRKDVYALMDSCDAYVSLHRAEGFGLTVAECMYLGKPVISTNWSATSEFVNARNGCPVDYKLVELEQNFGPYQKGQLWADPDPEDAARHMLRLYKDSKYARAIGQEAQRSISGQFSPRVIGQRYEQRLKSIALW